jgi:deoxyinosine 3'endonuclease (endonuclease V)
VKLARGSALASPVGFFPDIPCAGVILRIKDRVRPIYVSPGHKIEFADPVKFVLRCTRGYRIPEPTRLADIEVSAFKGEMLGKG